MEIYTEKIIYYSQSSELTKEIKEDKKKNDRKWKKIQNTKKNPKKEKDEYSLQIEQNYGYFLRLFPFQLNSFGWPEFQCRTEHKMPSR